MWSLVVDHARERANDAKAKALAAGKSHAEAEAASEAAFRGDVYNTAKMHLNGEKTIAKIITGIFGG